jgi:hypothetical protein
MAQFEDLLAVLGVPSNGQEDGSVYEEDSDQDSGAMDAIDGDAAYTSDDVSCCCCYCAQKQPHLATWKLSVPCYLQELFFDCREEQEEQAEGGAAGGSSGSSTAGLQALLGSGSVLEMVQECVEEAEVGCLGLPLALVPPNVAHTHSHPVHLAL